MKVVINGIEYVPVERQEIEVGDIVLVVNSGQVFPAYDTWEGWKRTPIECVVRARYGRVSEVINGHFAKVVHIEQNGLIENDVLAVIEMINTRNCYLIDIKGLKKVEHKVTIKSNGNIA